MRLLNRKALRDYHILESLEAGIKLSGAEVKSIRAGRVDLADSFVKVIGEEVYLVNANIPRYSASSQQNYDPQRSRKLLLHKAQIRSLIGKGSKAKLVLILVSVYEKNNKFKIEVGLARSKKQYDKRRAIKERDHLRRIEQELRGKE